MLGKFLLHSFVITFSAGAALADGQATIESPTPEGVQALDISWSGDGHVRFDPEQGGTYMLVRDGTLYGVTDAGGMGPMVMNLSSLEGMAGPGGADDAGAQSPGIGIERAETVVSIEPTGRSETVAGFDGELHQVAWVDADGEQHIDNAVLTDAPLAVELADAFSTLAATTQEGEVDPRQLAVRERGLAILRYGDSYTVTALSGEGRPEGAFVLPAEPTDLLGTMQGMGPNR